MPHITQLIIAGNKVPYSSNDKYTCKREFLGEIREMISGRATTEERGEVYKVWYEYDHMPFEIWNAIFPLLQRRKAIPCVFLTQEGNMEAANMICIELTQPTFAFDIKGEAYWHKVAFVLREERSHA